MQEDFCYENITNSIYPGSDFIDYGNSMPIHSLGSPQTSEESYEGGFGYFPVNPPHEIFGLPEITLIGKPIAIETQTSLKGGKIISLPGTPDASTDDSSQNKIEKSFFCQVENQGIFNYQVIEKIPEEGIKKTGAKSQKEAKGKIPESPKKQSAGKSKGNQSIFKNKYKEQLEQAKSIFDEIYRWVKSKYESVVEENDKTDEKWIEEGEELRKIIEAFEREEVYLAEVQEVLSSAESDNTRMKTIEKELTKIKSTLRECKVAKASGEKEKKKLEKQLMKAKLAEESLKTELKELKDGVSKREQQIKENKKELKKVTNKMQPLRTRILDALKFKRFSSFSPLYEVMDQIKLYVSKEESVDFFDSYKSKRSMKYFESHMEDEQIFYWIVIMKIVLTLLPQNKDNLSLLPLTKTTTPFMSWLMDSSVMKIKHKTLFKEFSVRAHLRKEFERVCSILLVRAEKLTTNGDWEVEKWETLMNVLNALGGVDDLNGRNTKSGGSSPSTHHSSKRDYEALDEDEGFSDYEEEIRKFQKTVSIHI